MRQPLHVADNKCINCFIC